ncbi:MAG TPA: YceI family protein [Rhodospirillaceae bacterium]|nr:YceI family protein [Rhodospirillaceae bacterium]
MKKTSLARIFALSLALLFGAEAKAGDLWQIDPQKSLLGFSGSQSGAAFQGHFTKWQAMIAFNPADPANGHALVTIDMNSATTGDGSRDQALPDTDWFDVKHFGAAQFEAKSFHALGGNAYEAEGILTIRGISRPVVLPFSLDIEGDVAHVKGKLILTRTDYGVGQGAWSSGQLVGLEVAVLLDLSAKRQ